MENQLVVNQVKAGVRPARYEGVGLPLNWQTTPLGPLERLAQLQCAAFVRQTAAHPLLQSAMTQMLMSDARNDFRTAMT